MTRNVPKKSEQIQRFKLKLPLNCWVFFNVKVLLNIALMCGSSSVPFLSFESSFGYGTLPEHQETTKLCLFEQSFTRA